MSLEYAPSSEPCTLSLDHRAGHTGYAVTLNPEYLPGVGFVGTNTGRTSILVLLQSGPPTILELVLLGFAQCVIACVRE